MKKKIIESDAARIVIIDSKYPIITDVQSAFDLLATAYYSDGCDRIAIKKEAITKEFFDLKTGIAGEILQKVSNFRQKLSIIGDFTEYTSKSLHDFIYESNNGGSISFVKTEQEAIDKLST